jgi:hypothetical protein
MRVVWCIDNVDWLPREAASQQLRQVKGINVEIHRLLT